jgi:hypothetical protein
MLREEEYIITTVLGKVNGVADMINVILVCILAKEQPF